jgi:hypothetical protein
VTGRALVTVREILGERTREVHEGFEDKFSRIDRRQAAGENGGKWRIGGER